MKLRACLCGCEAIQVGDTIRCADSACLLPGSMVWGRDHEDARRKLNAANAPKRAKVKR